MKKEIEDDIRDKMTRKVSVCEDCGTTLETISTIIVDRYIDTKELVYGNLEQCLRCKRVYVVDI
jgi:uncharacterized protein with PIN domain